VSTAAADAYERKPRNATDVTAFVDWRMYQWARFARDRLGALGYPRESISTKLLREIVLGINSPGGYAPDENWPNGVEVVERCVTNLCRDRRTWAQLVEVTYLTPRDEPNEVRARRLRMSPAQYQTLLRRFRTAMYGALSVADAWSAKNA
jgi:hypothetical protein